MELHELRRFTSERSSIVNMHAQDLLMGLLNYACDDPHYHTVLVDGRGEIGKPTTYLHEGHIVAHTVEDYEGEMINCFVDLDTLSKAIYSQFAQNAAFYGTLDVDEVKEIDDQFRELKHLIS